jgi:tRNA(Ile)-lysidine synthase
MTLRERLAAAIAALGVRDGDRIGVACSGGADSIALVHLLAARGNVVVLHVDHQLRDDSGEDAVFVAATAEQLDLPYAGTTVTVELSPRTSVEAAARDARYTALKDMARDQGLTHVLTAHTLDDQAETVMLRLMRGDTLDAIAPCRDIFVRPLLDVARAELRDWLTTNGVAWREDPTNDDQRFERNWVRHALLPLMHERRPGVAAVLARAAERAVVDDRALGAMAQLFLEDADVDDVGVFLPATADVPLAVLVRAARTTFRRLGLDPRASEVEAVVRLTHGRVRCRSIDVWRIDGGLAFFTTPTRLPAPIALRGGDRVSSHQWGIRLHVATDAAGLVIRSRRPGDRVRTSGGTRKVQDVLVDAKVPRPLRDLVPVLAADGRALSVLSRPFEGAYSGVFDIEPYNQTWSRAKAWIT